MKTNFSKAVDPVFLHVLELLERIAANESPDPGEERSRIRARLDQAELRLGQVDQWQLAKYALVAWIDEMLIDAPWDGARWWNENPLEFEIFRTAEAFSEFYRQANEALQLPRKDALEVFYICVVLGFRGMYKDPSIAKGAIDVLPFDLPPTLEGWAKRYGAAIQIAQEVPPIEQRLRPSKDARWRDGKFLFLGAWLIALILGAVFVATVMLTGNPTPP